MLKVELVNATIERQYIITLSSENLEFLLSGSRKSVFGESEEDSEPTVGFHLFSSPDYLDKSFRPILNSMWHKEFLAYIGDKKIKTPEDLGKLLLSLRKIPIDSPNGNPNDKPFGYVIFQLAYKQASLCFCV